MPILLQWSKPEVTAGMPQREAVNYKSETPFDNIESALEYVNHLLEATREAQDQIGTEILRAANPQLARRKQALQLVNYKLDKLSSHVAASRRILNDLRTLRRLLLEERKDSGSFRHSLTSSNPYQTAVVTSAIGILKDIQAAFPSGAEIIP